MYASNSGIIRIRLEKQRVGSALLFHSGELAPKVLLFILFTLSDLEKALNLFSAYTKQGITNG